MPGTAEDLLKLYEEGGWKYVEELVMNRHSESLHLDFKRKHNPQTAPLDKDDRRNLGEALSGFANSEGGLIVWGIDARRMGDEDVAVAIEPLRDVTGFTAQLVQLTPELVSPPVPGIRHVPVFESGGGKSGVVVTLIPESDRTPHMARGPNQHRYYRRAQSSFRPLEHFELEDLFGRRPHPSIQVRTDWGAQISAYWEGGADASLTVRFFIENHGRGLATFPSFTLGHVVGWKSNEYPGQFGAQGLSARRPPDGWWLRLVGGSDFVIYPDDEFEVGQVSFPITRSAFDFPDLRIKYQVVAAGTETVTGELFLSRETIREAVAAAFATRDLSFPA